MNQEATPKNLSGPAPPMTVPGDDEASRARPGRRRSSFGRPKHPRPDHCLNCGKEPLDTRFCPDCGQENLSHKVPLPDLLSDIGEEFVKWDGRLFRTLFLVLFRPGFLAREYNAGRRARFVSPFKMYFAVSALFAFLLPLLNPIQNILHMDPPTNDSGEATKSQDKTPPAPPPPPKADTTVPNKVEKPLSVVRRDTERAKGDEKTKAPRGKEAKAQEEHKQEKEHKDDGDLAMLRWPGNDDDRLLPVGYQLEGNRPVIRGLFLRAYVQWQADPKNHHKDSRIKQTFARGICRLMDSPENFVGSLIQSIGRTMFFLLPIYALLLAGLFRGARQYYVEHLVLAVNNHTFAFLLAAIVDVVAKRWVPIAVLLGLSYWIYEFVALRVVYRQRKRLTLFKQFALWQVYGLTIVIGFVATALLTLILP